MTQQITIMTALDNRLNGVDGPTVQHKWSAGPRNLLRALKMLDSHKKHMEDCYGNVGCGTSWIEVNGYRLNESDMFDFAMCCDYQNLHPINKTQWCQRFLASH